MQRRKSNRIRLFALLAVFLPVVSCGSGASAESPPPETRQTAPQEEVWELPDKDGSRDNTPLCLVPTMDGTVVLKNELAEIDCSNAAEGYIFARYLGENPKVKLLIQVEGGKQYYYDLPADGTPEVFPLSVGDALYEISVFENISETQYSLAFSDTLEVKLNDPYKPFLYPNQYVRFDKDSEAVKEASVLARPADEDLDVVSNVYNYVIRNITYDMEEAETVESGYLPDPDEVLATGKGICLDYSALMCAMLRSQQIPARMEIGYAGTAYHAWLSVYIDGIGWINGMIEFDGKDWSLMDPTFAASNGDDFLEDFIGDGDNYSLKFIY